VNTDSCVHKDWKNQIQEARHRLGVGSGRPEAWVRLVDDLVRGLGQAAGWDAPGRALVALGGYGREELAPWSDIDLLLLAKGPVQPEALDAVLYPLWDLGFDVGHALRSPRECATMAASDLTAATAFLDARLLLGDAAVLASARKKTGIGPDGCRDARRWIREIAEDVANRRRRFGDISGLLEPHLKEGRGGLRDYQATRWILRCLGKPLDQGLAASEAHRDLVPSVSRIHRIRNALHAVARRKTDHLTFEHHRQVAALVMPEAPVDRLFEELHRSGHRVATVCDDVIREALPGNRPRRRRRPSGTPLLAPQRLTAHIVEWAGCGGPLPEEVRAGLQSGEEAVLTEALREAAGEILRHRTPLAPLLRELHGAGRLVHLCPELAVTAHRVQYDARHAYTTGIHCLETLGTLEDLWLGVLERDEPHLTRIAGSLHQPAAVRIAALCHDLGKANGIEGHAEGGVRAAVALAESLGLGEEVGALAARLVRHHHQMTDVAFGADLEDPASGRTVWEAAGSVAAVDALLCLAFADLQATNPFHLSGVWSDWKRDLLLTLHARALAVAAQTTAQPRRPAQRTTANVERESGLGPDRIPSREARQVPADLLAELLDMATGLDGAAARWKVFRRAEHVTEVLGVATAFPALLSTVTGTLTHLGCGILSFQVHTWPNGLVHLWFRVSNPARPLDPTAVQEALMRNVEDHRAPPRKGPGTLRNLRQEAVPVETRVRIMPESHPHYTALEIRCRDRAGLIRDLACVFERHHLTVEYALATTHGPMARDVFHLKDLLGGRITGADKVKTLLRQIEEVCAPDVPDGESSSRSSAR
jgi:[protein-PII] uridylyltransferase